MGATAGITGMMNAIGLTGSGALNDLNSLASLNPSNRIGGYEKLDDDEQEE